MKTPGGQEPSRLVENPGEQQGGDPAGDPAVDSWAIDLLRTATPYRPPAGRKQRVKLSLGHPATRRAPLFLRPVIVAGMLIGCGAFASAALGHWHGWMARAYQRLVPPPPQVVPTPQPEARAHGHRLAQSSSVAASADEVAAPDMAVAPAPMLAPSVTRETTARETTAAPLRAHRAPSPAAHEDLSVVEDTSVVLEAMRALRLDRNPVRARVLLARYLDRHPTGTLAEEALAMSIEAAVAHHDGDAAALGARYLRLYPNGPFHALARQTQP